MAEDKKILQFSVNDQIYTLGSDTEDGTIATIQASISEIQTKIQELELLISNSTLTELDRQTLDVLENKS